MLTTKSAHAIYTPAISAGYAKIGHSQTVKGQYAFAQEELNFLDPGNTLFQYPYALYSAGQAAKTDNDASQTSIVSNRITSLTTVIGDSGGFQIQEGTIQFAGDETCERMLRWLEAHADYSMTLDFPTGGIDLGNVDQHAERLLRDGHDLHALSKASGLSLEYNTCLVQSRINLDYFAAHRKPGATNFLNVIQGRTERESKHWYDAVKGYGFEGWAFAGTQQSAFSLILSRLLDMYEDGNLQDTKWIHFLGVARIKIAYLFTVVLRCLRRINPVIEISFDAASPFTQAANFGFYTSYRFDKMDCTMPTVSATEQAGLDDSRTLNDLARALTKPVVVDKSWMSEEDRMPRPVQTAVGSKVAIGEIVEKKAGRYRVTTEGVWILMNHNVEAYVQAFEALNRSFDDNRFQDQMPVSVRQAKAAIEVIFQQAFVVGDVANARSLLRQCRRVLDAFV
jgi:hypothetical protein